MNYYNYFTEIEETFIRRRGKNLLLSPADWALIESWKTKGVPLHVALRAIERVFDNQLAQPRKRSVKSLFYCEEEVEAQFAEWLEMRQGAAHDGNGANGDGVNANGARENVNGDSAATVDDGLPFPRAQILHHLESCRDALALAMNKTHAPALAETFERAVARLESLREDFASAARPNAERLEQSLSDLESLLDGALRSSLAPEDLEARRA